MGHFRLPLRTLRGRKVLDVKGQRVFTVAESHIRDNLISIYHFLFAQLFFTVSEQCWHDILGEFYLQ